MVDDAGGRAIPSAHLVSCAIDAAALLDGPASRVADARESYWHRAAGGAYTPADLRLGERLLIDLGLVIEHDGHLHPTLELEALLDSTFNDVAAALAMRALELGAEREDKRLAEVVPDAKRREELLATLGRRFDDSLRKLYGAIGEELVVVRARAELEELGHVELARAVRHVSLETDQAGYDVSAPRVAGRARLLEVKATSAPVGDVIEVHLSRNEAEVGLRFPDWALVVCSVDDTEHRTGDVLGWISAGVLADRFPHDGERGRWESAAIEIAATELLPGLPTATG